MFANLQALRGARVILKFLLPKQQVNAINNF